MKIGKFVCREAEMTRLKGLLNSRNANLIVVRGRRRIEKSMLGCSLRSARNKELFFSEIPPVHYTSAQSRHDVIVKQLEKDGISGVRPDEWGNIIWHLSKIPKKDECFILPIKLIFDNIQNFYESLFPLKTVDVRFSISYTSIFFLRRQLEMIHSNWINVHKETAKW